MRRSIAFIVMLCWSALSMAQKLPYQRIDSLDKRPMLTVNGKIADPVSLFTLNRRDFQTIKWLPPAQAMAKFGREDGKYGAVELTMKANAKVLTWDQLLKSFNFNKAPDQMRCLLKMSWNMFYINEPRLLLTSPSRIWSAGIGAGVYGDYTNCAFRIYTRYTEDVDPETSPLDEQIQAISVIFDEEVSKRVKIESSKTVVRG